MPNAALSLWALFSCQACKRVGPIFQNLFSLFFFFLGMSSPDFDNQTLAVLRGRMVRYLMRSREVSSVFHFSRAQNFKEVNFLPAWIKERKGNHFFQ